MINVTFFLSATIYHTLTIINQTQQWYYPEPSSQTQVSQSSVLLWKFYSISHSPSLKCNMKRSVFIEIDYIFCLPNSRAVTYGEWNASAREHFTCFWVHMQGFASVAVMKTIQKHISKKNIFSFRSALVLIPAHCWLTWTPEPRWTQLN